MVVQSVCSVKPKIKRKWEGSFHLIHSQRNVGAADSEGKTKPQSVGIQCSDMSLTRLLDTFLFFWGGGAFSPRGTFSNPVSSNVLGMRGRRTKPRCAVRSRSLVTHALQHLDCVMLNNTFEH